MSLFNEPNAQRTRIDLSEGDLQKFVRSYESVNTTAMIEVLDGGGLAQLKARVIERFAKEITNVSGQPMTDSAGQIVLTDEPDSNWKEKIDTASALAIGGGMHTLSSMMGYKQINFKRATLFDVDSIYAYSEKGTWIQGLAEDRETAFVDRRMGRVDLLGCGLGASGGWYQINPQGYLLQSLDPKRAWVVHAPEIKYGEDLATADINNIEDASVVVIALDETWVGEDGTFEQWFLAIFGASENYPFGRMVKYHATKWCAIPGVGAGGTDYIDSNEFVQNATMDNIANPLTLYSAETKGQSGVEYPIFDWRVDKTGDGTGVFPLSGTLLFDLMFDIDVETSRNIESGGRSARGAWFLDDPKNKGAQGSISEGEHLLGREQDASLLSHSASNAREAQDTLLGQYEQIAAAHNVPSHFISTKKQIQATSGYMLDVMNLPITWDRKQRARINAGAMNRKFKIERALINFMTSQTKIPLTAVEKWKPGKLHKLETPEEIRADNDWLLKNGLKSIVDFFQETKKLETREQAIKAIEAIREDNDKYLKAAAPADNAPPGGIFGRTAR